MNGKSLPVVMAWCHQATLINFDQVLWHHMVSNGQNEQTSGCFFWSKYRQLCRQGAKEWHDMQIENKHNLLKSETQYA